MDDYIDHLLDCWGLAVPGGCTDTHRCDTAEALWAEALSTSMLTVPSPTLRTAVEHVATTMHAVEVEDTIREATEELRAQESEGTLYGR